MANAVALTEWDLYAKKKPCCTCSGGGKAVSATAQPSDLQLGHQSMQCEEQGTAQHGDKESAPIFCDPTISCSVEREIQVIPPVPSLFTLLRPYLAQFLPVFSRCLRVFTASPRRFQRAPSRNPGPRNSRQEDQERRSPPFVRRPRC